MELGGSLQVSRRLAQRGRLQAPVVVAPPAQPLPDDRQRACARQLLAGTDRGLEQAPCGLLDAAGVAAIEQVREQLGVKRATKLGLRAPIDARLEPREQRAAVLE
jgi:hypothetical protein